MTDAQLRGLLLQGYYDRRSIAGLWNPTPADFEVPIEPIELVRIAEQLRDQGYISGQIQRTVGGGGYSMARITASGSDVIEGNLKPAIAIQNVTHNINVSGSTGTNIAVGNNNQQSVTHAVQELVKVIESASASQAEKDDAKGRLRQFLEHPLVVAVAAGALSLL